jgi:CheY-like chemotaxis protein
MQETRKPVECPYTCRGRFLGISEVNLSEAASHGPYCWYYSATAAVYNMIDFSINQPSQYFIFLESAINGALALSFMKKQKYDLVLMDINMPVMDGIETTILYRTHEKKEKRDVDGMVYIIGITGDSLTQKSKAFALDSGIIYFLLRIIFDSIAMTLLHLGMNALHEKSADLLIELGLCENESGTKDDVQGDNIMICFP